MVMSCINVVIRGFVLYVGAGEGKWTDFQKGEWDSQPYLKSKWPFDYQSFFDSNTIKKEN